MGTPHMRNTKNFKAKSFHAFSLEAGWLKKVVQKLLVAYFAPSFTRPDIAYAVKNLTTDLPFIWETVRGSSILEVQEDKIRRRNDWKSFILHSPRSSPSTISPQSINDLLTSALAAQVNSMGLANGASHHQLPAQGSLSSGELGGQSR